MKSRLVVAVSGGVDSVVLLHKLVRADTHELVVAHFDHGIRPDSAKDATFVKQLADSYNLKFEATREELGAQASEEVARTRRYAFLRQVAHNHHAEIVTAHHMDDIAETIAINLTRGTGWRGLACLSSDVVRPLLGVTKAEIIAYAKKYQLNWREDSTNSTDAYLRNRIRQKLARVDTDGTRQLAALRARQVELRDEIASELAALKLTSPYSRYFFIMLEPAVVHECLRVITESRLTRPQQERALRAIATYRSGQSYEAGSGVTLHLQTRQFSVELAPKRPVA